jgi:hypothetical protein
VHKIIKINKREFSRFLLENNFILLLLMNRIYKSILFEKNMKAILGVIRRCMVVLYISRASIKTLRLNQFVSILN